MLSDAVFLVRSDARLVNANTSGEKLLRHRDGLACTHGFLVACNQRTNQNLRSLIDALTGVEATRLRAGSALQITRPSGKAPFQALIASLPKRQQFLLSSASHYAPLAVLIVVDPAERPVPLSEHLALFYGFTPAEARLAAALAKGGTLTDYAERAELSIQTVRWMLKQLEAKTDTRRLPQLVHLLSTGPTALIVGADRDGESEAYPSWRQVRP